MVACRALGEHHKLDYAACDTWLPNTSILSTVFIMEDFGSTTHEQCWSLCKSTTGCNSASYTTGSCVLKAAGETVDTVYDGTYESKRECEPGVVLQLGRVAQKCVWRYSRFRM